MCLISVSLLYELRPMCGQHTISFPAKFITYYNSISLKTWLSLVGPTYSSHHWLDWLTDELATSAQPVGAKNDRNDRKTWIINWLRRIMLILEATASGEYSLRIIDWRSAAGVYEEIGHGWLRARWTPRKMPHLQTLHHLYSTSARSFDGSERRCSLLGLRLEPFAPKQVGWGGWWWDLLTDT